MFDLSADSHGGKETGDERGDQRAAVAPPAGISQLEKLEAHTEA